MLRSSPFVLLLLLVLVGQLAVASPVTAMGSGCEAAAQASMTADCDHPACPDQGQCQHCAGALCMAWTVPAGEGFVHFIPIVTSYPLGLRDRAVFTLPDRIYRPPRFPTV